MADWDKGSPADTDIVSQFPANERAAREAVETNFGVDHREVDDADIGAHEKVTLLTQPESPTQASGRGFLYTKTVEGQSELFWLSSSGEEVQLTREDGLSSDKVVLPALDVDPDTIADAGQLYTKLVEGVAELFWMDSDGNVLQLTSGGSLSFDVGNVPAVFGSVTTESYFRGKVIDVAIEDGTCIIDWEAASVFRINVTEDITDLRLINMPDASVDEEQTIYIDLLNGGNYTIANTVEPGWTLEFPNLREGDPGFTENGRDYILAASNNGTTVTVVTIFNIGPQA